MPAHSAASDPQAILAKNGYFLELILLCELSARTESFDALTAFCYH
jgi:hypothetical protein